MFNNPYRGGRDGEGQGNVTIAGTQTAEIPLGNTQKGR